MPDLTEYPIQKTVDLTEIGTNAQGVDDKDADLGYSTRLGIGSSNGRQKRTHLLITIDGVEKPSAIWAKQWGVTNQCVHHRVNNLFPLDMLTSAGNRGGKRRARASTKQAPSAPSVSRPSAMRFAVSDYNRTLNTLFTPRAAV